MAATVREAILELFETTERTLSELLALADEELVQPSDHVCAQGKDVWTLLTNDIDHEKIHTGQVLEARYEARITQSEMARLLGDWLRLRADFIASLVGLTDEQFNQETAPGGWTYRQIAKHLVLLEQDTVRSIREAIACREPAPSAAD